MKAVLFRLFLVVLFFDPRISHANAHFGPSYQDDIAKAVVVAKAQFRNVQKCITAPDPIFMEKTGALKDTMKKYGLNPKDFGVSKAQIHDINKVRDIVSELWSVIPHIVMSAQPFGFWDLMETSDEFGDDE